MFGTLQKRLPQELRLARIKTVAAANRYLKDRFVPAPLDRQRIDKWLWHARVVRTRSAAAALAAAGHVRINGQRIDASSHPVRPGGGTADRCYRCFAAADKQGQRWGGREARVL